MNLQRAENQSEQAIRQKQKRTASSSSNKSNNTGSSTITSEAEIMYERMKASERDSEI